MHGREEGLAWTCTPRYLSSQDGVEEEKEEDDEEEEEASEGKWRIVA